jgi:hypothetical protein
MNEPFDSLEAELKALRPEDLSTHTRQRIARELEITSPSPTASPSHFAHWCGAIAAFVAACLLIAFVLRPPVRDINPSLGPVAPEQASLDPAFDDALPSVWTYRRALIRSPVAAEDLLDKHATVAPRSQDSFTPVFVRFSSALHIQGEL